jgi:threonine/homoserine/homoserine lactone efflux protein
LTPPIPLERDGALAGQKEVVTVSNVLGILIGVVVVIVGFILLGVWWVAFLAVLKGIIPLILILIGAGVLVYFISEIKSKLEIEKEKVASTEEKKPE